MGFKHVRVHFLGQAVVSYLEHADEGCYGGHGVQGEFADVHLHYRQAPELRTRDEDEEQYKRDDGKHEYQDSYKQALMCAGAVH